MLTHDNNVVKSGIHPYQLWGALQRRVHQQRREQAVQSHVGREPQVVLLVLRQRILRGSCGRAGRRGQLQLRRLDTRRIIFVLFFRGQVLTHACLPTTNGHMAPHTSRMTVCMAQLQCQEEKRVGSVRFGGSEDWIWCHIQLAPRKSRGGCSIRVLCAAGWARTWRPSASGSASARLGPPSCTCVSAACSGLEGSGARTNGLMMGQRASKVRKSRGAVLKKSRDVFSKNLLALSPHDQSEEALPLSFARHRCHDDDEARGCCVAGAVACRGGDGRRKRRRGRSRGGACVCKHQRQRREL
jgi:hypothetical protein